MYLVLLIITLAYKHSWILFQNFYPTSDSHRVNDYDGFPDAWSQICFIFLWDYYNY